MNKGGRDQNKTNHKILINWVLMVRKESERSMGGREFQIHIYQSVKVGVMSKRCSAVLVYIYSYTDSEIIVSTI